MSDATQPTGSPKPLNNPMSGTGKDIARPLDNQVSGAGQGVAKPQDDHMSGEPAN
ncbi:hypothetical protein [Streptomyces hypolithicus]